MSETKIEMPEPRLTTIENLKAEVEYLKSKLVNLKVTHDDLLDEIQKLKQQLANSQNKEKAVTVQKPLKEYKVGEFVKVVHLTDWVNGKIVEIQAGIISVVTAFGEKTIGSPDNIKIQ